MKDLAAIARLRRRRDASRRILIVAMALLLVFGFGFTVVRSVSGGGGGFLYFLVSTTLATALLMAIVATTVLSSLAWMYWGWRLHRADDPWDYDPDLDGPDPRVRRGLEDEAPPRRP